MLVNRTKLSIRRVPLTCIVNHFDQFFRRNCTVRQATWCQSRVAPGSGTVALSGARKVRRLRHCTAWCGYSCDQPRFNCFVLCWLEDDGSWIIIVRCWLLWAWRNIDCNPRSEHDLIITCAYISWFKNRCWGWRLVKRLRITYSAAYSSITAVRRSRPRRVAVLYFQGA